MDQQTTSANTGNPQSLLQALSKIRDILKEAEGRNIPDPTSVSLATADPEGRPSVRTIYLHSITDDGPIFFINLESGKGKQIVANPHVGLCLYLREMQQQVTLEGVVSALPEEASDEFWSQRSRASQLASWASDQGKASGDRDALRSKRDSFRDEFDFEQVPRPQNWRALLISPTRVEFWDTGWHKMHQRHLYSKQADGSWSEEIENP